MALLDLVCSHSIQHTVMARIAHLLARLIWNNEERHRAIHMALVALESTKIQQGSSPENLSLTHFPAKQNHAQRQQKHNHVGVTMLPFTLLLVVAARARWEQPKHNDQVTQHIKNSQHSGARERCHGGTQHAPGCVCNVQPSTMRSK